MTLPYRLTEVMLLNDVLTGKRDINGQEKSELSLFMDNCVGNMAMYKNIKDLAANAMLKNKVAPEVVSVLLDLSFCTRHIDELTPKLANIMAGFSKLNAEQILMDSEKISLHDYAILRTLAAIKPVVSLLQQHHLISQGSVLFQVAVCVDSCHQVVKGLEMMYRRATHKDLFDQHHTQDPIREKFLGEFSHLKIVFIAVEVVEMTLTPKNK